MLSYQSQLTASRCMGLDVTIELILKKKVITGVNDAGKRKFDVRGIQKHHEILQNPISGVGCGRTTVRVKIR